MSGQNLSSARTKTDAVSLALAEADNVDSVAVFNEGTGSSVSDINGLGTVGGELDEGAVGIGGGSRDGSRAKQISGLHVATSDGVVHQLLAHGPVHVFEVTTRQDMRRLERIVGKMNFEVDVVRGSLGVFVLEVGKNGRVLDGLLSAEGLKGLQSDHPGRDSGGKVLGGEGTQRHVLPRLNVASAPIVHESNSKDVGVGVLHGDRITKLVSGANEKGEFQLVVQALAARVHGLSSVLGLELSARAANVSTRDDDARSAAVITDGQPKPVGQQGSIVRAEHLSQVGGVFAGRVEISIIADAGGHQEHSVGSSNQGRSLEVFVLLERSIGSVEEFSQSLTNGRPDGLASGHEVVQRALKTNTN